jgi:predicted deacylase
MTLKQNITSTLKDIWKLPKKVTIPSLIFVIFVVFYIVFFVVPKNIEFSYAGTTCTNQLTLFPDLHKTVDQSRFRVEPQNILRLGKMPVISNKMCFIAEKAPQKGVNTVASAPFGAILFRSHFNLKITDPPLANASSIKGPVPVTKPLKVNLTTTDRIFEYKLVTEGKTASCKPLEMAVACDIEEIKLEQGKDYKISLQRAFKGKDVVTAISKNITTLTATTITDSSVKKGELVFSRPKSFELVPDKKIVKAGALLTKIKDGKTTKIDSKVVMEEGKLRVDVANELERETDYILTISNVEAADGSSLVEPYVIPFKMSGGPKVTGVSVGKSGVGLSGKVVVSFDQALSPTQDIGKLVTFGGGSASIARSGNQIIYSLNSLPKCADFSLTIAKGLNSAYDITSNEAWNYGSRTVCHTVSTIGYSKRGRAINAYFFGNGASTVLYVGAIHGDEPSSSYILNDWINELEANAKNIPANRQIVVVPTVNPDGVAAGTRNNAGNVNLNRNFATNDWKQDINDTNGTVKDGGGTSPMSEPETQAIANLSSRLRPRLVLSYHAVGSVAIGNEAGDSGALAAKYASLVGYDNGTGNSSEIFSYEISGTYDDWLAQKLGSPSIIIELGSYSYRNFGHHRQAFWAMATS